MKVRFVTLGCKLNFAESSAIGRALLGQGLTMAADGEAADVCVLNTCSVTDAADHKCRQALHRLRRENPEAVIIATGCFAQLAGEKSGRAAQLPAGWEDADYLVGNEDKMRIPLILADILSRKQAKVEVTAIAKTTDFCPAVSLTWRTRCFLKVQDGCNFFCTYCTIPMARGRSRNPRINDLVTQAQQAIDAGAKEIVLTGVNIADFGRSTNETFYDLLVALDNLQGDYRVRIGSCEPNLLYTDIIDYVAQSKHLAPHFHIPLQSGSNEMLRIMHRHYNREQFAHTIAYIRQVLPDAFIGVDCMVGVRGETEEYFDDYYRFVSDLDVSQLHVFTYSERADTRMMTMDLCVVPDTERKRRSELLHRLSDEKHRLFTLSQQHKPHRVLWESKNDRGMMSGFTENYLRMTAQFDPKRINTFSIICDSARPN